ncbi:MAG: DNA gyrase subunit A [Pleurocapsa minor GSE-CHR-MK-17-07R]|jgi:DNA gyrase subunit A|nr:DNA gyrase subunit A [Pleurocapsa minor GSE-CHR-MK 17-07R]
MTNPGLIRQINIGQEMRDAYLDYAMSVIVARALPDARDGLKPVHRRILYAMWDMGIRADTPYKKCARIVGEVLGKYHPHGDGAVYESLVRMAQDFSMRNVLVDGQGNFGSVDGDGAAAMRYTEARMAQIGEELLVDIQKETVDFVDNFDGTLAEPAVLPASFPNLLVNGSSGIAVGMSTNIPPHNLGEVCDALIHMLGHWETLDDISIQDLMQFVKGPDFPTGGLIYHHADDAENDDGSLVSAYATGRGKITMRARCHIEDMGRGKSRIIVSELPYQTNKSALVERIAQLVRDGRIEGISDLRDESDRQGLRLAIELARGAEATEVLALLFKLTQLQETFSIIMLALVNGEPRTLSLKQALRVYLDHRLDVVRRRSEYDLARARDRAHILEGIIKAIDRLDEAIATIRKSRTADDARINLIKLLDITEIQARAILEMQLRRLAALEREAIETEYKEKLELIAYLESLLNSPADMRSVIAEELGMIKQAYAEPRRSVIVDSMATAAPTAALLMPQDNCWVTLSSTGKIGRSFDETQPKVTSEVKDAPQFVIQATTDQIVYLFAQDGLCTSLPVHQLPQVHIAGEGSPVRDVTPLKSEVPIATMLCLSPSGTDGFLFFATRGGEVKRLRMDDLPGVMANAFKAIDIEKDDALLNVTLTNGEQEVMLVTAQAAAIRFKEADVRPTGLGAGGMRGIKLADEKDRVIAACVVHPDGYLVTITEDGLAKQTPVSEYPSQGRAGAGVIAMKLIPDSPGLSAAIIGHRLDESVLILTSKHRAKTARISAFTAAKRAGKGEPAIALGLKEQVSRLGRFDMMPTPATAADEPSPSANGTGEVTQQGLL